MNERVAYVNGKIVPESKATISIKDRGFVLGDAVFDTTRTFGHEIFRLKAHLDRLFSSLRYMRIDPGMTQDDLASLTMQVLEANLPLLADHEDYWVTQRFTRGAGISLGDPSAFKPTVIIECQPLPLKERARLYRDGLAVATPSIRRTPPEAMSPRAKMHNYINLVLADLEVKGQNPDAMAITLDINGNLCEGMGSNIFIVKDGAVLTPREQTVRSRRDQPRRNHGTGREGGHYRRPEGHRPIRRLHRRRGLRDFNQLLRLRSFHGQRYSNRRWQGPGAVDPATPTGLQHPRRDRHRPAVPPLAVAGSVRRLHRAQTERRTQRATGISAADPHGRLWATHGRPWATL